MMRKVGKAFKISHKDLRRTNNLRIILKSLGISQPQTSGVPRTSPTPPVVDEVAPSVEIVNHNPEGGNEPKSQQQEQQ